MNFLAHAFLAGEATADRAGGMLGDFVKGPLPAGLPAELASGLALHRAIDSFADRHQAFRASRARISAVRRRVGGILVDLFYDHLLARDWADYATPPLEIFTEEVFLAVAEHAGALPEHAVEVARRMQREDWLGSYRNTTAVGRMALYRLRRTTTLAGGIEEFIADREGFEADFRAFLPDALAYSADWRARRYRLDVSER
jgi:acyl carrier protein phosphodiesterase